MVWNGLFTTYIHTYIDRVVARASKVSFCEDFGNEGNEIVFAIHVCWYGQICRYVGCLGWAWRFFVYPTKVKRL